MHRFFKPIIYIPATDGVEVEIVHRTLESQLFPIQYAHPEADIQICQLEYQIADVGEVFVKGDAFGSPTNIPEKISTMDPHPTIDRKDDKLEIAEFDRLQPFITTGIRSVQERQKRYFWRIRRQYDDIHAKEKLIFQCFENRHREE